MQNRHQAAAPQYFYLAGAPLAPQAGDAALNTQHPLQRRSPHQQDHGRINKIDLAI